MCLVAAALARNGRALPDPLDAPYWRTFHISTIGVGTANAADYRQSMLSLTDGVMPRNIKVGFAATDAALMAAGGGYYDYLPSVFRLQSSLDWARTNDLPIGVHLNALPWNDSAQQSSDVLHNMLEQYGGGLLLQTDRAGRFRKASLPQDPALDEEAGTFSPYLEMQLTLSPYAPLVQDYLLRNTRLAARHFAWLREQAPDLVAFCTLSSEFGMNVAANSDYCDYSPWSRQEFRDWLCGAGLYAGLAQYATLADFNAAFAGAAGFPWAGWAAVAPPTNALWNSTASGLWWQKWHEFRVAQVRNIEQNQMRAAREAGWNPDRLFGHQIPGNPASTTDTLNTKHASPWTTTFVQQGGNGITTYGASAASASLFSAVSANDKSWGICEYNPLSTNVAANLGALNAVWNAKAHLLCPYNWVQDGYAIKDSAFLTALQQFVASHRDDAFTGLAAHEAAPASRDLLWSMSGADDVESLSGLAGASFTNGSLCATVADAAPALALALDESRHTLASDAYGSVSLRLFLSHAPSAPAALEWADASNATASVSFAVQQGWNLCRVNLAGHPAWRERRIRSLTLRPPGDAGAALRLDWLQMEALPCWHFDDAAEAYGVSNFSGWAVTNGQFSGASGADGYVYLATDTRSISAHADRAFIDADTYKKARVRLTSSAAAHGQLYWWKGTETPYAVTFPVAAGTRTYEVDLSGNANWSGAVTRFRLDPVNVSGVTCAVDYVSLAPARLPPRAPLYETIANSPNPVFIWEPATEPNQEEAATYDFQLATDFEFSNVVFSTASQRAPHVTYIGPELDGQHWWRARACGGGSASPWLVPMPLFARVWNGDTTNDFTSLHGLAGAVSTSGVWSALTDYDPYFSLNTGNSGVGAGVNADLYKVLQVRLRVSHPSAPSSAQFFFFPKAGGTHSVTFTVPPDGQWYERTVDLSSNANWSGYMSSVRLDPTSASNALVSVDWVRLLPGGDYAANRPPAWPALGASSNRSVIAGQTLTITNAATDPNGASQTLRYSLLNPPAGASLDASSGVLSWRPTLAQAPQTHPLVWVAADSGTPSLSATQTLWVAVGQPAQPVITAVGLGNGQLSLSVTGDGGPDYTVLASTNLLDWTPLWITNPPSRPFTVSDPSATNFTRRFYRVLLGP